MDKQRSWSLWWVNFEANSESLKFKWSVGVLIRIQWGFCVWNCDHVIVISTHTARHLRGAKILSRLSHMVIILYKIWNDWNLCIMYVLLLDDSTLYDFKLAYRRSHALQRVTGLNWISNYNFQFQSLYHIHKPYQVINQSWVYLHSHWNSLRIWVTSN